MCKKENLRREAVAIAKQEIQDEQEAEREANTLSVVQPIKGYLKHDQ